MKGKTEEKGSGRGRVLRARERRSSASSVFLLPGRPKWPLPGARVSPMELDRRCRRRRRSFGGGSEGEG